MANFTISKRAAEGDKGSPRKKIKIEILGTDVVAVAELLEEEAPKTTAAMWQAFETPVETKVIHAMLSGRELWTDLPEAARRFDPRSVPKENMTIHPVPGDMGWLFLPGGYERGWPDDCWDMSFVYAPDVRFESFVEGPRPMAIWAQITEGLEDLAVAADRMWQHEGPKMFRISRLES